MNIKSLLLGSAAALVAVSGARAADAVVVAEPEPVEYVKVCDAYGAGFYYIPGTETCLKISGYVRADISAGDDAYSGAERDTYDWRARALLRFDARSETELGTLKSFAELRYNFKNGADAETVDLNQATIELGGFRVGAADSQFTSWTGYLGGVINDDVILEGNYVTNQISYTFTGGNGFSAFLGLEQGSGGYDILDPVTGEQLEDEDGNGVTSSNQITDYTPHVVAGAKFEQAWGAVSGVVGYDSVAEEWAGKLRVDAKFSDTISAFIIGGYKTNDQKDFYGTWNGDFAVWGGLTAKVSDKATANGQVGYEDDGTIAAALNVEYELVPGFKITPEINYTKFGGFREVYSGDDAIGGIIRFQRNF